MKDLKIPFFTVLFIFIGLTIYTKLTVTIPLVNNETEKTNVFHVQGTGKATGTPDLATATIGVTYDGATVLEAQTKINEATTKVVSALKKIGINEKDIKTQNYSINPRYGYMPMRNTQDGYTASQNIEIKTKSVTLINKAIDTATANGANVVNAASFTFSDDSQKKLENQAREMAVKDAKDKAQTLSKAAGMNLGKVVDITESNDRAFPVPMFKTGMGSGTGTSEATPPTQINPGENTVTINVDLSYEIR